MSDSLTTATPEAKSAAPMAHPPVRENQLEAEVDRSQVAGQRVMRSIGGGSPEAPPEKFTGALGGGSGGLWRQMQRSHGNQYVGQVIQRKCDDCEKKIQRKGDGDLSTVPEGFEAAMQQSGSGQPLDDGARSFLESSFGQEFGDVRIHTDGAADEAAKLVRAQAFTTGRDIYFGQGRFQPQTQEGQKLLAHELTHVVQQQSGGVTSDMEKPMLGASGDRFEQEADAVAERIVGAQTLSANAISPRSQPSIQRYPFEDFVDSVGDVIEDVGEGLVETGEAVAETATGVAETVAETATDIAETVAETATGVAETVAETAIDIAEEIADFVNGLMDLDVSVSLTGTGGFIIEFPDISLCDDTQEILAELPRMGVFIPLLAGGGEIGPILVAGALGILATVQPQLLGTLGPCELRNIRLLINPFTHHYAATAQLYVAAAISPRLVLFGGLAAFGLIVLPLTPPLPIVVSLEGGLRGTATGWAIGAIQSTVSIEYLSGSFSFSAINDFMAGVLLQGDLDIYIAARIFDKVICEYAYPLLHWEAGQGWQLTVPITAGTLLGGSFVGIGPITFGPIPIEDIETAIEPLESGFHCRDLEEIIDELCEDNLLPEELCEGNETEDGDKELGADIEQLALAGKSCNTAPGDCTVEECKKLQAEVNKRCKTVKFKCKKGDSCKKTKGNIRRAERCAKARDKINNKCYKGGDEEHRDAADAARRAAENCRKLLKDNCK